MKNINAIQTAIAKLIVVCAVTYFTFIAAEVAYLPAIAVVGNFIAMNLSNHLVSVTAVTVDNTTGK